MEDTQDTRDNSAQMLMSEFIKDVENRHSQMMEYKANSGTGIAYSESSTKYQDYIRTAISKQISCLTGISSEMALNHFDGFVKNAIVADHLAATNSATSTEFFSLKKQIKAETDKSKKGDLNQKLDGLIENIYTKLSPEDKTKLTDNFIDSQIIPKHANLKMRAEINAPDEGYCLKAITQSLHKITEKYGCNGFLPANVAENGIPQKFLQNLETDPKIANHIFRTKGQQTFRDLVEQNNIEPGAIVILNNSKGNPHHAMFWNGKIDKNGEPLLMGFNGMGKEEENDVIASYTKDGNPRQMAIINTGSIIKQELANNQRTINQEMQNTNNDAITHSSFSNPPNQKAVAKDATIQQKLLTSDDIKLIKMKISSGKSA